MNAKQDVTVINVLVDIAEQLKRIAAALEAQGRPTITMIDGMPTDPHTSYAVGDVMIGRTLLTNYDVPKDWSK